MNITTFVNNGRYTDALGHFTFDYGAGRTRILKKPIFVNDHHCDKRGSGAVNPFISTWEFDTINTPPKGAHVTVRLALYTSCDDDQFFPEVKCDSANIEYQTIA